MCAKCDFCDFWQILEIAQFAEFAEIASDKGENGKVRCPPQSLRDSSPINKGAKKFTIFLKRSRGVGRII